MKIKKLKIDIINIVIAALIGGLVVFFINYLFYNVPNKIAEFDKKLSGVEAKLETIIALKDEFKNIKQDIINVQKEVEDIKPQTIGRITYPKNNIIVGRNFDVSAKISNSKTNKYYFIANEIDGKFWPKFQVMQMDKIYTAQSDEGGNPPKGRFNIALFEVDKNENDRINEWLKGPDFPGIQIEGKLLDRIEVILNK